MKMAVVRLYFWMLCIYMSLVCYITFQAMNEMCILCLNSTLFMLRAKMSCNAKMYIVYMMWTPAFYQSNMKQNTRHWNGPGPCELPFGSWEQHWLFDMFHCGGGVYLRKGRPILNKRSIVDAGILPLSIFTPRVLPHARIGRGVQI